MYLPTSCTINTIQFGSNGYYFVRYNRNEKCLPFKYTASFFFDQKDH